MRNFKGIFSTLALLLAASCTGDPDCGLFSAPDVLEATYELRTPDVLLSCEVSRSDNISGCGFLFGTDEEKMNRYAAELPTDGRFEYSMPGLTYGVDYYFRPFISNGTSEKLSGTKKIFIEQQLPGVKIESLTMKDATTMLCEYTVTDNFSGELIIRGLCWEDGRTPDIKSETKSLDGAEYGTFTTEIKGLEVDGDYHIRAYAVNGKGTAYSEECKTYIPVPIEDAELKRWMVANHDTDGDGDLSPAEASAITSIDLVSDNIRSLGGLDYLKNLTSLVCKGSSSGAGGGSGMIAEADLGANTKLTGIDLSNNRLTSLVLPEENEIVSLDLAGNPSLAANLPALPSLRSLDITGCALLDPDFSKFTDLEELHYSGSGISDIQTVFKQAKGLRRLYAGNSLKESDRIYLLQHLESLDCAGSRIGSIDLRYNTELTSLNVDGCPLKTLDLNLNPGLTDLHCLCQEMTELYLLEGHLIDGINANLEKGRNIPETVRIIYTPDVKDKVFRRYLNDFFDTDYDSFVSLAEASAVKEISIDRNEYPGIASLHGIEMFTSLETLNVSGQSVSSLDLSKNVNLKLLVCDYLPLVSLDLGGCAALTDLYAQSTHLTGIDLSACAALERVYLSGSPLKSLDLKNNRSLRTLDCSGCALETLDISSCPALESLDCRSNPDLASVTVSATQSVQIQKDDKTEIIVKQ